MKFKGTITSPIGGKLLDIVVLVVIILLSVAVPIMFAPTPLHRFFVVAGLMCLVLVIGRVARRYHDLAASKQHRLLLIPLIASICAVLAFGVVVYSKWGTQRESFFYALEVWLVLTAVVLEITLVYFPTYIACTNCAWIGDMFDLKDKEGKCPRCRATQSFVRIYTDNANSSPVVTRGSLSDIERILKKVA